MPTHRSKTKRQAVKQTQKAEQGPPEPAWRNQRPPRPRRQLRHEAVVQQAPVPRRRFAVPTVHLPAVNWRPVLRYWMLLPVTALVAFVFVELFTSDRFYVYGAQVRGNQRLSSEEIYAASEVEGQNVFWLQPTQVSSRVAAVSGIKSVETHIRLPNQVVIDVEEQVPLVAWQVGDQVTWIAEDGEAIPASGPPPFLTLIDPTGAAAAPALPGTEAPLHLRPKVLAGVLALRGLRIDLTELHYGPEEGLYFSAPQGWTVYLGLDGDVAAKISRLQAIQKQIAADPANPKVVDLRTDGRAFYR